MKIEDLALQRSKYKHLSDEEWRWFLQQVEGRERTADKLPTFAAIDDWWYPVRLSCEQCSSELTAKYKAEIILPQIEQIGQISNFVDLTGGYGVDTYFLSEHFDHTDYVEQNAELCRIAEHNKGLWVTGYGLRDITIHNTSAEEFLNTAGQYNLIFLDPARRDSHGGKVFRLEDCTPNVVELLPTLLSHGKQILLKLSPMLDLTQALKELSVNSLQWSVHVVAVKNEVKELLLLSQQPIANSQQPTITAIDLAAPEQAFVFTREEEKEAQAQIGKYENEKMGKWLYEPNAAILKSGAYKLVAQRFGLTKLDVNTHLYVSDTLVPNFHGRVWKIANSPYLQIVPQGKEEPKAKSQANVLVRNYPLTAEQLKKKLHLRDGGERFIIGCRVNGKPVLFEAERV